MRHGWISIALLCFACSKSDKKNTDEDPKPPDKVAVAVDAGPKAPGPVGPDASMLVTPLKPTPVRGLIEPTASADVVTRGNAVCQKAQQCGCQGADQCGGIVQSIAPHAPGEFWSCMEQVAGDCTALCTEFTGGTTCYAPHAAAIQASMTKANPAARGAALCKRVAECACADTDKCQGAVDALVMDTPEPFWTCMEEAATDCTGLCTEYKDGARCYAPHEATIKANRQARENEQYRYSCWTTGVYEVCDGTYCRDQVHDSMGAGPTEMDAQLDANQRCSNHITNMIISNNINGHAGWKQSCQITRCQKN